MPLPKAAGRCPTCGHSLDRGVVVAMGESERFTASPAPDAPSAGERARGRRTVLVTLAAAAVAGGVLFVVDRETEHGAETQPTESSRRTRRAPDRTNRSTQVPPGEPGMTLPDGPHGLRLVATGSPLLIYDVDTGVETRLDPVEGSGSGPGGAVPRGDGLVMSGPEATFFLPELEDGAEPVAIGPEAWVLPSDDPDRVWLWSGPWFGGVFDVTPTVREVDLSGRETVAPVVLPQDLLPVGPVAGGLVLNSSDGVFVLDRDGSTRRVAAGVAIGTNGSRVVHRACDPRLRCQLHVTDVSTRRRRAVPDTEDLVLQSGFGFFGGSASLSPDGEQLAASTSFAEDGGGFGTQLSVIDLASGEVELAVPPELFAGDGYYASMAWSPDGEWLFIPVPGAILAFRLADGVMFELPGLGDGGLVALGPSD